MKSGACRWGILGTATIARKTWQAIHRSGNARLVAVASRDQDRCQAFIDECQSRVPVPHPVDALSDYASLLARDDIDAVYVPLPTGMRKEWVIRAAEAGKHVLCEKPCAITAGDLQEMLAACRKHHVQFMDGVMYMHTGRLAELRRMLDSGDAIGRIKRVTAQFSFNAPPDFFADNIRSHSDLEPQGCVGDLGWYTIRFALWAMNWQMPTRVVGRLLDSFQRPDSPNPVPTEFSAELFFPDATASFYCSFRTHHQQWAVISGERGYLWVQDFVLPFFGAETRFEQNNAEFIVDGCDFSMEQRSIRSSIREHGNSHETSQETNLIRKFSHQVLSGRIDELWPTIALNTQQVMDACLTSSQANGDTVAVDSDAG